jgi:hypothetical protein
MGGKATANDPRFVVEHKGASQRRGSVASVAAGSDGQLLFLVNNPPKMKDTPHGPFTGRKRHNLD